MDKSKVAHFVWPTLQMSSKPLLCVAEHRCRRWWWPYWGTMQLQPTFSSINSSMSNVQCFDILLAIRSSFHMHMFLCWISLSACGNSCNGLT